MGSKERQLAGRFLAVGFLLLFYALALGTSLAKTPTIDEPVHFLRGVVLGQTGDLHLQFEHAPLSHRLIGALLLTETSLPDVRQLPSWQTFERTQIAHELVWESGLDVQKLFFLARLPVIWLGLLLGSMIGSWALAWLGRRAMVVALTLFSVSPNLIASSALATTDLTAASFYFAAVYAWWRSFEYQDKKWWLMTAVFLGLALATKLTAVLLLPVLFLLALLYRRRVRSFWHLLLVWLGLLPIALLVLWIVYGLEFARPNSLSFSIPAASYVRSWQNVLGHIQEGHTAFFLGELSNNGWWSYFPVTFLIKTPVVSLILLLIGIVTIFRCRKLWRTGAFLILPGMALVAVSIMSRLNIGYRHILPALPFLLVASATAGSVLQRRRATRRLLLLGLMWVVFSGLRQYPDYLAYFNEIVGGSDQGYRFLGDSNLDWGQDLRLLAEEIEQQGGRWFISYAGVGDPGYYGLPQEVLLDSETASPSFAAANPASGSYALSANHLQGLLPDKDFLDWFRRRNPDYNLGGSILVFEVDEQATGAWVAHCLDPTAILSPEQAERLLGQSGLRHLFFDCRQSWTLPGNGVPGWFVMPQADSWWFLEQSAQEIRSGLQLVYRHQSSTYGPSYDVFYWSGNEPSTILAEPNLEVKLSGGQSVDLPQSVNELLQLDGYQIDGAYWITEWSIEDVIAEPISLQAHLYSNESEPPLVADSLGFSSEQWQPGDRLLQRFEFPDQGASPYLETGVYNYRTLERLGDLMRLFND